MNNEVLILKKNLRFPDYHLLYPLALTTILATVGFYDWDPTAADSTKHALLLFALLAAITINVFVLVRGVLNSDNFNDSKDLLANTLTNKYGIPFIDEEIDNIIHSTYNYVYISYLDRVVLVHRTDLKSGFCSFILTEYNGKELILEKFLFLYKITINKSI